MLSLPQSQDIQPLGRIFSTLGKGYLHLLRTRLQHLDIDRNYYALVLIESHDGEITQQELAALLDTDKVSVVRLIDYLSEKGYVRRVRKTDDKRKLGLVVTPKAKLALPEIKNSITEINKMMFNGLTDMQIAELTGIISQIKRNISGNLHNL